jgi:hypothetical protein
MAIRASRNVLDASIPSDPTCLIIGSVFLSPDSLNAYIGTGTGVKQLVTGGGFVLTSRNLGSLSASGGDPAAFAYLIKISDNGGSSSGVMTGGAAEKTYVLEIDVNRPVGSVATGDSNDALLKMVYNNYAANDANFVIRGINTVVNNRAGGTVGNLFGGLISTSNKSGAAEPAYNWGLSVDVQNLGTGAGTELIGLDVALDNEGSSATTEAGIRIRNRDQSNVEVTPPTAILVPATAGNTKGWSYGLDFSGATIVHADVRLHGGAGIYTGSADPNGSVSGTDGSIYLRTGTSTASTVLYVCTGTTTWTAITVP